MPLFGEVGAREVGTWRDDLRGLRIGLGLPGVWLLGRWVSRGHRQLVALRFASDAEMADLVRDVLAGKLASGKEIKGRIKHWQADWLRA